MTLSDLEQHDRNAPLYQVYLM